MVRWKGYHEGEGVHLENQYLGIAGGDMRSWTDRLDEGG